VASVSTIFITGRAKCLVRGPVVCRQCTAFGNITLLGYAQWQS